MIRIMIIIICCNLVVRGRGGPRGDCWCRNWINLRPMHHLPCHHHHHHHHCLIHHRNLPRRRASIVLHPLDQRHILLCHILFWESPLWYLEAKWLIWGDGAGVWWVVLGISGSSRVLNCRTFEGRGEAHFTHVHGWKSHRLYLLDIKKLVRTKIINKIVQQTCIEEIWGIIKSKWVCEPVKLKP